MRPDSVPTVPAAFCGPWLSARPQAPPGAVRIEHFLSDLRRALEGFSDAEAEEILRELGSHLLEQGAAKGEAAAVAAMGSPEDLAALYRGEPVAWSGGR